MIYSSMEGKDIRCHYAMHNLGHFIEKTMRQIMHIVRTSIQWVGQFLSLGQSQLENLSEISRYTQGEKILNQQYAFMPDLTSYLSLKIIYHHTIHTWKYIVCISLWLISQSIWLLVNHSCQRTSTVARCLAEDPGVTGSMPWRCIKPNGQNIIRFVVFKILQLFC